MKRAISRGQTCHQYSTLLNQENFVKFPVASDLALRLQSEPVQPLQLRTPSDRQLLGRLSLPRIKLIDSSNITS
jgi:hypothetical protein